MAKVSRYQWPTDRQERIALIISNLTIYIPPGRGAKGKATKEELEEQEEGNEDGA